MKTLTREEMKDANYPEMSGDVKDYIFFEGHVGNGPELEEELPNWIPNFNMDIREILGGYLSEKGTHVNTFDVREKSEGGGNISRFMGLSDVLNESMEYVARAVTSSFNLHAQTGSGSIYFKRPVSLQMTLPMGDLEKYSRGILKEVVPKLTGFDGNVMSGSGLAIGRIMVGDNGEGEMVQEGREVIEDFGIDTSHAEIVLPF